MKNLEKLFDFTDLDENYEPFSNENERVIGEFKIETPKNIWIDEFVCLKSKMYSFECQDVFKNILGGISKLQSKHIIIEEYKKCLDGVEYERECNNSLLR